MNIKRFDNKKFFVLKTILFNNRFTAYKLYIRNALNAGYKVCSMNEFWNNQENSDKHFVLRHDVDDLIPATRKMFEIEKQLGVHSTYYFRWTTIDSKLIDEMLDAGFDVGLHYETVATYIREHKIEDKECLPIEDIKQILKKEIIQFKNLYNPNMTSCCSHGALENIKLGVSSNILLEDVNYKDFGIEFEAYDKNMYERNNIYHIMDGNIRNNYGFSYKSNPMDGIIQNEKNIVFLAHPAHWKFTLKEWIKNIILFLMAKNSYSTEREFRRIAK